MFGSGGKSPKPPPYSPAPPYQDAPPYTNAPTWSQIGDLNKNTPQVSTPSEVGTDALGLENQLTGPSGQFGWMNLNSNPTDAVNVSRAQQHYLATQMPQLAQDESNLNARGQAGSSYAGAYLGQEQAMNNFNAWNAGINQQQADFGNVLNARNALYSQPVALAQQQNASAVQRALNIGNMYGQQNIAMNDYNLSNNQGFNQYGLQNALAGNQYRLGASGQQNNYNSSIYGSQVSRANAQSSAGASMFGAGLGLVGDLGKAVIGKLQ